MKIFVILLATLVYFGTLSYCLTYPILAEQIVKEKDKEIEQLNKTIEEYKNIIINNS